MDFVLYFHILAACAWIGGSIVLFGLGVFIRDKETQRDMYGAIGPFYGYFETVWLILLMITGMILGEHYQLWTLMGNADSELAHWAILKLQLVMALTLATILHLAIAFATHKKSKTVLQTYLSRGGSLAIFLLNLAIVWVAMNLRTIL